MKSAPHSQICATLPNLLSPYQTHHPYQTLRPYPSLQPLTKLAPSLLSEGPNSLST